jgi:hypothetical protein
VIIAQQDDKSMTKMSNIVNAPVICARYTTHTQPNSPIPGRRELVAMIARILQIVVGVAGLCALALGLLIWIANIDLISIHMLFGILVTLGLLVMSILAVTVKGLRVLGIVGIVYAIIVPILGASQFNILVGNLHWLIQTLHMLVGIGAIALTGISGARYMVLQREAKAAAGSQALR